MTEQTPPRDYAWCLGVTLSLSSTCARTVGLHAELQGALQRADGNSDAWLTTLRQYAQGLRGVADEVDAAISVIEARCADPRAPGLEE